ncbi:hypothetical protein ABH922_002929 [Rhodococcus sp. 27YEA15]|uniref:condensation domain-containing protein n=1 Tax=Rhodococcus sp. 27YEA15 TaxID=3156259 RepID=UPI003C7ACF77
MDLDLITHWQPKSGRVVEWRVTREGESVAASAETNRDLPPTTMQDRHLRRARVTAERGDPQSPWIGIAFDFDGPLDRDAMTRSLATYVRRHDTLHSWFSFDEATTDAADTSFEVRRHIVPAASIDLEYRASEDVLDPVAIRDLVAARFASETSALSWPAFVFGAVEHEAIEGAESSAGFTLFHAIDHAHTDMNSMVLTYSELRRLYTAEITGSDAELGPAGSFAQFGRIESERAAELTLQSPEVHKWLSYVMRSGGSFPGFPLPLGADDAPKPAIGSRFVVADEVYCEKFGAVCKANGANFIGGIFTALAIAQFELTGRADYTALSPVSTRSADDAFSQGWYINLIPVGIDIDDKRSFTQLCEVGQKAYHSGKELLHVSVQQVIDLVLAEPGTGGAVGLSRTLTPPPVVSYIDARRLQDSHSYDVSRVRGIVGGKDTQIASMWINRMHDGVWMAISHPDTPIAHDSVKRFADLVSSIVETVAEQGDYEFTRAVGAR